MNVWAMAKPRRKHGAERSPGNHAVAEWMLMRRVKDRPPPLPCWTCFAAARALRDLRRDVTTFHPQRGTRGTLPKHPNLGKHLGPGPWVPVPSPSALAEPQYRTAIPTYRHSVHPCGLTAYPDQRPARNRTPPRSTRAPNQPNSQTYPLSGPPFPFLGDPRDGCSHSPERTVVRILPEIRERARCFC